MARLSTQFSSLRRNVAQERRILRSARLGRSKPKSPYVGDAFRVVGSTAEYKNAFDRNKAAIDFFRVLSDSWKARKDWRP